MLRPRFFSHSNILILIDGPIDCPPTFLKMATGLSCASVVATSVPVAAEAAGSSPWQAPSSVIFDLTQRRTLRPVPGLVKNLKRPNWERWRSVVGFRQHKATESAEMA